MNEQLIRELEKQCWTHRVDGALVDGQLHFDIKKFAELIVRECEQVSLKSSHRNDDMGAIIARNIKKHFGVEE